VLADKGIVIGEARMVDTVQSRMAAQGIVLPTPAAPQANYIPTTTSGRLVFVSGQVSIGAGNEYVGKVGVDFTTDEGREAARLAAINLTAVLKAAVGDLERVMRILKVVGFVICGPDFTEPQKVINGASELLISIFGDRGRHARSAIGVNALPLGAAVEVEAIVEVG
jgi:enamine deaminase RidA (YjgF/YER057c/UK114 family)